MMTKTPSPPIVLIAVVCRLLQAAQVYCTAPRPNASAHLQSRQSPVSTQHCLFVSLLMYCKWRALPGRSPTPDSANSPPSNQKTSFSRRIANPFSTHSTWAPSAAVKTSHISPATRSTSSKSPYKLQGPARQITLLSGHRWNRQRRHRHTLDTGHKPLGLRVGALFFLVNLPSED